MSDDMTLEDKEEAYQNRNETLQTVIDVVASHTPQELDEFGKKSKIAREHSFERHQIDYVLNHWPELVEYRRNANRSPVEAGAVQEAYDDETLQTLAANDAEAIADGAGNIQIEFSLSLDQAFRAIKLLPGDLGLKLYTQLLTADLPHSEVRRILGDE